MLSPLLCLAVPGEAPVTELSPQHLCLQMNECQSACERIHSRLQNLFAKLQEMDREDQLPSSNLRHQYADELKRYLCFLQRHHDNKLLFRVFQHRFMVGELEELNKCVTELFVKLLDVDTIYWNIQWEEDCFVQKAVLDASLSDTNVLFRDLQSSRAQLEALLTLKVELGKIIRQKEEEGLIRVKALIETITYAIPKGDLGLKYYTAKDQAVRTLANLTVDKKNRAQITREEGILPLAKVLQDGTPCQTGQAARALANLAIDERNIDAITQAGAIPSLVSLLRGSNDKKTKLRVLWLTWLSN
ncbi:Armadillo-type fold [Phytophthora cactorum]|nr:Armadillo-type fold [Phytophthora cactorum]